MAISGGDIVGMFACTGLFGWIPVMVWWKHRIRLEELRMQHNKVQDEDTVTVLRQVQRELRELRETTTHFDLSFDAGMSRLEERVTSVENGIATPPAYRNSTAAHREEPQTVLVGNRER